MLYRMTEALAGMILTRHYLKILVPSLLRSATLISARPGSLKELISDFTGLDFSYSRS